MASNMPQRRSGAFCRPCLISFLFRRINKLAMLGAGQPATCCDVRCHLELDSDWRLFGVLTSRLNIVRSTALLVPIFHNTKQHPALLNRKIDVNQSLEQGAFFNRLAGDPSPLVEHGGFRHCIWPCRYSLVTRLTSTQTIH